MRRVLDFKSMERGSLLSSSGGPYESELLVKATKKVSDIFSKSIYIVTGFIDGSFNASNTSYCRSSLVSFESSMQNLYTASVQNKSVNSSVFYGSRILKYFHPSTYHCYYAGKETYTAFSKYMVLNSINNVFDNMIYKTGQVFTNLRIIYKMIKLGTYLDKEMYVIMRSVGSIMNELFSP